MFACIDNMINVDKIGMYFANTYLLKLFRRDNQFIKFVGVDYITPKL